MSTLVNISKILRDRRVALGISQQALADYCGFAQSSNICRLEADKLEWKFRDVVRAAELLRLKIEIKAEE